MILSGGTDGEDGPTDAAGAVLDGKCIDGPPNSVLTWRIICGAMMLTRSSKRCGGLLMTGPTGTNVCDVRVVVVDRQ